MHTPHRPLSLRRAAMQDTLLHKAAERLVDALASLDRHGYFQQPVDSDSVPGYAEVITNPMCFDDMRKVSGASARAFRVPFEGAGVSE